MVRYRELLQRLNDHGVPFIVIGGVAASLLGSPMATLDVDVCAPLDEANLQKIIEAMRGINPRWRMRPDKVIPFDDIERFRGVKNVYLATDLGILDILGDLPGIGSYDDIQNKTVEFDLGGFTCRVLEIDTLIAAKRAAGRDKDLVGVRHLEAVKRQRGGQKR